MFWSVFWVEEWSQFPLKVLQSACQLVETRQNSGCLNLWLQDDLKKCSSNVSRRFKKAKLHYRLPNLKLNSTISAQPLREYPASASQNDLVTLEPIWIRSEIVIEQAPSTVLHSSLYVAPLCHWITLSKASWVSDVACCLARCVQYTITLHVPLWGPIQDLLSRWCFSRSHKRYSYTPLSSYPWQSRTCIQN
jgi:hypothetical protein